MKFPLLLDIAHIRYFSSLINFGNSPGNNIVNKSTKILLLFIRWTENSTHVAENIDMLILCS